jgi:hypothetical protein
MSELKEMMELVVKEVKMNSLPVAVAIELMPEKVQEFYPTIPQDCKQLDLKNRNAFDGNERTNDKLIAETKSKFSIINSELAPYGLFACGWDFYSRTIHLEMVKGKYD